MTPLELKFLLGSLVILLSLLAYIGRMAVDSLRSISKDINEMKIEVVKIATKHDNLEKRVDKLEEHLA
jgi:cell division protein FtsB